MIKKIEPTKNYVARGRMLLLPFQCYRRAMNNKSSSRFSYLFPGSNRSDCGFGRLFNERPPRKRAHMLNARDWILVSTFIFFEDVYEEFYTYSRRLSSRSSRKHIDANSTRDAREQEIGCWARRLVDIERPPCLMAHTGTNKFV